MSKEKPRPSSLPRRCEPNAGEGRHGGIVGSCRTNRCWFGSRGQNSKSFIGVSILKSKRYATLVQPTQNGMNFLLTRAFFGGRSSQPQL